MYYTLSQRDLCGIDLHVKVIVVMVGRGLNFLPHFGHIGLTSTLLY